MKEGIGAADKRGGEKANELEDEPISRNSTDFIIASPSPSSTVSSLLEDKARRVTSTRDSASADEFDPLLLAEIQIELDKVKEQSQFTISNLEDSIKELKE